MIRRFNSAFDQLIRLLNYKYYHLRDIITKLSLAAMQSIEKFAKSLDITLKFKFNESDPILILDFLSLFVEEADILDVNKVQAYLVLPFYLNGASDMQLCAMRSGSRSGSNSCRAELVQYVLPI